MRIHLLLLLAGMFLISCQQNDPALEAILTLEAEVEANATPENTKALTELYRKYVDEHQDDVEKCGEMLYKSAALQFQMNHLADAVKLSQEGLKRFYESKSTPENALLLARLYEEKLRNPMGAQAVRQAYVRAFPDNEKVADVQSAIPENAQGLAATLDTLRSNLYNEETNRIEYQVASDFINVAEIQAMLLPASEEAPSYLYEAGKTAGYIRAFPKAVELYEWIYNKYPEHKNAPQALFMMGFTYDNEIGDSEKAKTLYADFISKYPEDDFADDAKFLLDNLGKSDEEIIESFE